MGERSAHTFKINCIFACFPFNFSRIVCAAIKVDFVSMKLRSIWKKQRWRQLIASAHINVIYSMSMAIDIGIARERARGRRIGSETAGKLLLSYAKYTLDQHSLYSCLYVV